MFQLVLSCNGAAEKLAQLLSSEAMDALLANAEACDTPIDGPEGLLAQITKSVLERVLDVEIADHLAMTMAIRPGMVRVIPATVMAERPC